MGTGTDVAIESAGITIINGDLKGLVRAHRLSCRISSDCTRRFPDSVPPVDGRGRRLLISNFHWYTLGVKSGLISWPFSHGIAFDF